MKSRLVIFTLFLISGCGIQINQGLIDNSDSSSATATINSVDQTDDDNTSTGFGGGVHIGTAYSNGVLSLNTTTNNSVLDESWTPKWSNIVGYWQAENNWNDSVGGNHGTVTNDVTFTTNSKIGSAAGFINGNVDLNLDYVDLGNDASLRITGALTISVWITDNQTAPTFDTGIVERNNSAGPAQSYGVSIDNSPRVPYFEVMNGTPIICRATSTTSTKWMHLTAVYIPSTSIKLYVNGVLECENTTSIPASLNDHSYPLIFGHRWNFSDRRPAHNGYIDDVAIWNTDLTQEDILTIYERQAAKFAGEIKSRIMDSKDINSTWTNLDWITTLPFGKELTGSSGSESSSDYSSLVGSTGSTSDNDLMNGLIAYWNFNETSANGASSGRDFEDLSSNNYSLSETNGATFGNAGKFDNAVGFDGVNDSLIGTDFYVFSNSYTASVWFYSLGNTGDGQALLNKGQDSFNYELNIGLSTTGSNINCSFENSGTSNSINSTLGSGDYFNKWTHVLCTYDNITSSLKLFVNGELRNQMTTTTTPPNLTQVFRIGQNKHLIDDNFYGYIDETAIWNRALHANEALQIYRRGANRIKYQVRTCSTSDCSDQNALTGDGWKGPGGNYLTYFSELYNNSTVAATCTTAQECYSSELSLQGNVLTTSPSINFSDFTTDGLLGIDNNRYFQYRVIMESDDENTLCDSGTATCLPELKSVTIGPAHSYEE